ncbi:MAG: MarR family transcriptional regulator [Deltaproteobacteria bacterium]|jgi:DNA-binding MarR family transcriptional regulator|nr:MarR family transcriptional regulator [Deltaproteobacteria bacterium]
MKRLLHPGKENHLIREIMITSQALLNVFSREVGMTSGRLALLRLLAVSNPDGVGIMELARLLGVNAAAVTRQVKGMEKDDLVERSADHRDGRRSYVRLTDKGRRLFGLVHDRAHEFEKALCGTAGEEDIAVAVSVLAKVRGAIERLG